MDNVLNFVYDDWQYGTELPKPNGEKLFSSDYQTIYKKFEPSYNMMNHTFPNIKYVNRLINDVETHPDETFIYHIWSRPNLCGTYLTNGIIPISNTVIRLLIKNKNLRLLFMNECEIESKLSLKLFSRIIDNLGINPKQVWFVTNNSRIEEYKTELGTDINVHSNRTPPSMLRSNYGVIPKLEKDTSSFFLCHNRTPKIHRYGLLCLLKKHGIIDNTDWSLINGAERNQLHFQSRYSSIFNENDIANMFDEIMYFDNISIYKSKYEKERTEFDDKINQHIFLEPKTYENSYVNLVTESNFNGRDVHISEKSFKPFLGFQFPLILASYQHIKFLREKYDFDLFDDVISHNYDNIENDRDRLFKFFEETNRINDNKPFFIDFYKNNQGRFLENYRKLYSLDETYDYNFFMTLNAPLNDEKIIIETKPKNKLNMVYDSWDETTKTPINSNSREIYKNTFQMTIDSSVWSVSYSEELIERFPLSDVEKYPDKKFFYFICLTPGSVSILIRNGFNPIIDDTITYWRKCKNLNIVFMNDQESEPLDILFHLDNWTKSLKLPQTQLWVVNNNPKLEEEKKIISTGINVHSTTRLSAFAANNRLKYPDTLSLKTKKEGKLFLCHNKRPRIHRFALLCILRNYGILGDVDWSLMGYIDEKVYNNVFTLGDMFNFSQEITYFSTIKQKKSFYEEKYDWFDDKEDTDMINWNDIFVRETYENTYVNIATETNFEDRTIHISEKSFKPFCFLQFPLILASPYHIKEMRKLYDLDFFDDVISHDYDNIENDRLRLFKFAKEVQRIYNEKDFFIKFYNKNTSRFIRNYEIMQNTISDNKDLVFLKTISDTL